MIKYRWSKWWFTVVQNDDFRVPYLKEPQRRVEAVNKLGDYKNGGPQVTVAISTKSWSSDLDDFGVAPILGNLQMVNIPT